jgi:hypothetical protein
MARPTTLVAVLIGLLAAGSARSAGADPLGPLYPLQAKINHNMRRALRGQSSTGHFHVTEYMTKHLEQFRAAGVVRAVMLAMRFDLVYLQGQRRVQRLRALVRPTRRGPRFVSLSSRPPEEEESSTTFRTLCMRRATKRFCRAAEALARATRGRGCARLGFVTPRDLAFLPPGRLATEVMGRLKRSRADLPATCARLARLRYDRVEARTGEVRFVAFGADRKPRGVIEAKLVFAKDYPVIRLTGFTPLP